ncbi:hypothetical protein, partial [Ostreibacterium oceani]
MKPTTLNHPFARTLSRAGNVVLKTTLKTTLKSTLLALTLLAGTAWSAQETLTPEQAAMDNTQYEQVTRQRVSRRDVRFEYKATLVNKTERTLTNISATVKATPASEAPDTNVTAMPETTVTFPDLAPGESALSNETFEMTLDRTRLFSWDNITWQVRADGQEEDEEVDLSDPEAIIPAHPGEAGKLTL